MTTLERISFSALASFARCGEEYRRSRIAKDADPTGLPALVGNAFHEAAELFECDVDIWAQAAEGAPIVDHLHDIARQQLRIKDNLRTVQFYGKQDAEWWLTTGLRELADKYIAFREAEIAAGFRWFNDDPAQSCEIAFKITLADDLPPVVGYIDQVFYDAAGLLVIRDLKTGEREPSHKVQGNIYAIAWQILHPEAPADYVADLYLKGKEATQETFVPSLGPLALAHHAREYVRSVEAGIFPHNGPFTDSCRTCHFSTTCPTGIAMRGENVLL